MRLQSISLSCEKREGYSPLQRLGSRIYSASPRSGWHRFLGNSTSNRRITLLREGEDSCGIVLLLFAWLLVLAGCPFILPVFHP